MKKIKTINKLLSSLTLLSPLVGVGFNNQYQNTQKVITENNSVLNSYFNSVGDQRTMGGITVNVEGTTITGYVSGTGNLVVDSDITEISATSFKSNENITSLDLSNATNLTTIGGNAFYKCTNLTGDLVISSSVTSIGNYAFSGTNITSLDLSQATNLITIGDSAFYNCKNLTGDFLIPSNVTSIEYYAFAYTKITSLDLSNATSLTSIGENAFYSCSKLTGKLVIPSSVTSIARSAFGFTQITSLDLSNATSLTTIGSSSFENCSNLTGNLVIPQNLTSISSSAFRGVTKFTSITVDPLNKTFSLASNLGSNAYVLISGTDGIWNDNSIASIALGDIKIPTNITSIGTAAFSYTSITSLDLSQATSLTTIADYAFQYCSNLTGNLVIPQNLTSISNSAFYNCLNLTGDLTIPSSVTNIEIGAFSYTGISSLDLSQATSLTTIGERAFESCSNLTGDIVIPSSVTTIGRSAFAINIIDNLYFSSETPPTSFGSDWQPTVTGKVYVPTEAAKQAYLKAENFGFTEDQIEISSKNSNTGLILGLIFGLGIPIILAAGFGIWYLTKKKKTTVKI